MNLVCSSSMLALLLVAGAGADPVPADSVTAGTVLWTVDTGG
jgi:hypothetical protein